ncbi:alpha/beta hydrolase [Azospirillum sp. YIM B02556]|uniref:Alpha/beta hydrolase n=1 Tax=Azospirillum endophyticum TaxID=2800326 RepID=A0ABS1FGZ4_9PROT|nr:alpha/beta hydrolase [Azospirillum endophyticum]MBK1842685.1 alpha/beta hydrolase [Azospirillum endophyticum]
MIESGSSVLERHNVSVIGSRAETLVLIPGFGTEQSAWRHVVEAFRDRYRIVLFDLAGVGPGSQAHFDHVRYGSLDAYARDVVAVLETLRVDRGLCVGHSVAGMVAALASVKAPHLFGKLIMLGASACYRNVGDYRGGFESADIDGLIDSATRDYMQWTARFGQMVVSRPAEDPTVREFVSTLRAMRPDMALSLLLTILRSDVRNRLGEVTVPAVILQARQDAAVAREAAEYLHDRLAGSVLEILDASGHLPHMSAPDTVIAALGRHLS